MLVFIAYCISVRESGILLQEVRLENFFYQSTKTLNRTLFFLTMYIDLLIELFNLVGCLQKPCLTHVLIVTIHVKLRICKLGYREDGEF